MAVSSYIPIAEMVIWLEIHYSDTCHVYWRAAIFAVAAGFQEKKIISAFFRSYLFHEYRIVHNHFILCTSGTILGNTSQLHFDPAD